MMNEQPGTYISTRNTSRDPGITTLPALVKMTSQKDWTDRGVPPEQILTSEQAQHIIGNNIAEIAHRGGGRLLVGFDGNTQPMEGYWIHCAVRNFGLENVDVVDISK